MRQSYLLTDNPSGVMYAAGTLISTDNDYRVAWRSFDDLFSVRAENVTEYRVDSFVPNVSETRLREAGAVLRNGFWTATLSCPMGCRIACGRWRAT